MIALQQPQVAEPTNQQPVPYRGNTEHFGLSTMQYQEQEVVNGTHEVWYPKVFSTRLLTWSRGYDSRLCKIWDLPTRNARYVARWGLFHSALTPQ